jgi:hypothetical protein
MFTEFTGLEGIDHLAFLLATEFDLVQQRDFMVGQAVDPATGAHAGNPFIVNSKWPSSPPIPTQADVSQMAIDHAVAWAAAKAPTKAMVETEADRRITEKVTLLTGRAYSAAERATWPEQTLEAITYTNDPTTDVALLPVISGLAATEGVSMGEYVTRVMQRRAAFIAISTPILAAQNAILAMDPIPDDYNDNSRWPA